jgi:hypothetical protein
MVAKVRSNFQYLKQLVTIIFSKDRPMQLSLTLDTNKKYCVEKNARNEIVIWTASTDQYAGAYQQVIKEHPDVVFIKEANFKEQVIDLMKRQRYIMFLVDDCIFTRQYSLSTISSFLDICDGVLGFSLRLGYNTKICYPIREENEIPYMQELGHNVCAFSWRQATKGDFSYPLEISSSIYRGKDIKPLLEGLPFDGPNSLEWAMSQSANYFRHMQFLLCYRASPAFCNPVNKVQTTNNNRVGTNPKYSTENLLNLYEEGYRINPDIFEGFISNGAHQEAELEFIKKE